MPSARKPKIQAADRPASVLTKAFLRAAGLLAVPQKVLARIIGVSEASVSRLTSGGPDGRAIDPASKEGELALLFVRTYRSLDVLLGGDPEQCRRWFHVINHHLGGRPIELAQTARGLVHVSEYLDAMRGKI